ncbi:MAG: hypothetical protein J0L84_09815, partial [Verrucomicrobia bacterium]|nr:hypothetical protein [Verrucomicrobiota bacterium]
MILLPDTRHRFRRLRRIEQGLLRRRYPRLEMALILSISGVAAALVSALVLRLGLESMALRYPMAAAAGYGVFLLLLRLWLRIQSEGRSVLEGADGGLDLLDVVSPGPGGCSRPGVGLELGDVSDAGGALELGAEEFGLLCIVVLGLLAGVLACLYLVWTAPALLAELLVDGLVLTGVHRMMRRRPVAQWLPGVFRRTWFPAVCLMFFLGLSGFALQR